MPTHHIALDSWRGLAAILVALHHFTAVGGITASAFVKNSWIFVDFFFLLSGFIIARNYRTRITSVSDFARFMVLRIGRLYPLHIAVLGLWIMAEGAAALTGFGGRKAFSGPYEPRTILDNILLIEAFGPAWTSWNAVSWSVATEMWSYVVFGLVVLLAPRRNLQIAALLSAAAAALLLAHAVIPGQLGHGILMIRCLYAFMAGVLLAEAYEGLVAAGADRVASGVMTLLEFASVAAAMAFIAADKGPLQHLYAVPVFAPVILVFAFDRGGLSRLLALKPFAVLGLLSYSIYMIHPFVQVRLLKPMSQIVSSKLGISAFTTAPDGTLLWGTSAFSANVMALAMLAIVILLSAATYAVVERPAREGVRHWLDGRRTRDRAPARA